MTPDPTRSVSASTATADNATDGRNDPAMRALYKMSRTAGVGLQDYAAINVRAVIGLLLGIASVLAFIFADSTLPLLIPLAAIIVSAVALVQVSRSNGTQTGRALAIGGLIAALAFGGLTINKQRSTAAARVAAQQELVALVEKFDAASRANNGPEAYGLFTTPFRNEVKPESFNRTIESRAKTIFPGTTIADFQLGKLVNFDTDQEGNLVTAGTLLTVIGGSVASDGSRPQFDVRIDFVREGGVWKIQDISNWFATAQRKS